MSQTIVDNRMWYAKKLTEERKSAKFTLPNLPELRHNKDGGYNSTNISKQLSPGQNTPALQAKIVPAPMPMLTSQGKANRAPPEPKHDKHEKKCFRKRKWTSEEAHMEMRGKNVKMISKIEQILNKLDSNSSDED